MQKKIVAAEHDGVIVKSASEFLKTIYLGDRAVKGFEVDAWKAVVKVKIDLISRIRSQDGNWNYYDAEDIEDGYLVFEDVTRFEISPVGAIPNDYISSFVVEKLPTQKYRFHLESSASAGEHAGECVFIRLDAAGVYLVDPQQPDVAIRD